MHGPAKNEHCLKGSPFNTNPRPDPKDKRFVIYDCMCQYENHPLIAKKQVPWTDYLYGGPWA